MENALRVKAVGALVAAAALTGAGCSSGSKTTTATTTSFELNGGRSLALVVPDGWAARAYQTKYSIRGVILEPQGDPHLESDATRLADGESAEGSHVIIIESGKPCVGGQWDLGPVLNNPDGDTVTARKASLLSEGNKCAHAKAGDREASADLSAVRVLEKLTDGNAVVAQSR